MKTLREFIDEYPTKHDMGFVDNEVKELISLFPEINMEKFFESTNGNTCMLYEGETISYHCDILQAIMYGLPNEGDKRTDEYLLPILEKNFRNLKIDSILKD